jgi:hypothetical protein
MALHCQEANVENSTYKGSKIEWDDDECAAPLVKPQQIRQENNAPKKKNNAPLMNRFHLLNMDGTEDSSLEDEDHDASGITFQSAVSPLAS